MKIITLKKYLILLIITTFFFACKNNKKSQEQSNDINNSGYVAEIVNDDNQTHEFINSFDWSKPELLKQNFITELIEKSKPEDVIVMTFLIQYADIKREFNDILFYSEDYHTLNEMFFSNDDNEKQIASDFEKKIKNSGLDIEWHEGIFNIRENTSFIKEQILELLNPISIEFLNLYCKEIDEVCCSDGAIIISEDELVDRIYNWGELFEDVYDSAYEKEVKSQFYTNLNHLYSGMDNSPAFDWETKKYRDKLISSMYKIIKNYPQSKAAFEFKEYIALLEKENFMETNNVIEFVRKKYKMIQ